MPAVRLVDALEELEEARETEEQIQHLVELGTDDPAEVKRLEGELIEDSMHFMRQLREEAGEPVDPLGLDWEEDWELCPFEDDWLDEDDRVRED
jgi:hypothetical protein